jgi:ABC-type glycerol-3-phosphate transport system permease component
MTAGGATLEPVTRWPDDAGRPVPPARRPHRAGAALRRLRRDPAKVPIFLALLVASGVMLYPFGFMVYNSLKSESQYLNGSGFSTASWSALFSYLPVGRELLNSALVCVVAIFIILALSSSAGFAFAKLHFRGQGAVFVAVIGCMMVPLQSIIIPEYVNLAHLHLVNTYEGAILVYAALGTPFATFLMMTFFRGLPDELVEAAVCDGLGYGSTFWRVALPMAKPALATVAVLQFIQIWDDLLVGLLFLQEPTNRTITVGLGVLASGRVVAVPELMAGSLISALPAVIVYLIFQRYLVAGLTLGVNR